MLSDEEKKAIETVKVIRDEIFVFIKNHGWIMSMDRIIKNDTAINSINIVLNLIEKQSKKIEKKDKQLQEKENIIRKLNLEAQQYFETTIKQAEQFDKEIEELKEYKQDAELTKVACCSAQNCEALNNCIKLTRELQNADKKWKDKIKAKIEELEKQQKEEPDAYLCIKVLQSLLEKE